MGFSIYFLQNERMNYVNEPDTKLGEIIIGSDKERFESSLAYWKEENYQNQWRIGIGRILEGEGKSCLITSMYDPVYANFIRWWLLYRQGQTVMLQEHILFMKYVKQKFDPLNPYPFIQDRRTISDGSKISEWKVPESDLQLFYNTNL